MRKMFIFISSLMLSLVMYGQTVLINPAQEGGFELGPDFASNGWTLDNGTQVNQWFVGTVPVGPNNNSAYVSNDAGVSWAYTNTTAAVVHFYRDITFPAGETDIQLTFLLRGIGESTFDRLRIYLVPTTTTPVAGTELTAGQVGLANYNFQRAWIKIGLQIPASAAGTTQRLVFSWRNDGSAGTPPPVSIDNIALVSQTPYTMAGIYTIDNTLPTAGVNFNSFNDAILSLNSAVIAAPITFIVTSGQQFVEILPIITATGTSANTITFTKSGIVNPIILSGGFSSTTDAIVAIRGGDYFTFNGFDLGLADPFQNTVENGYFVINASATDGAQFNTFTNTNIALNRANTVSRGVYQHVATAPTNATGANSNNVYSNINVSNSYNGIVCNGNATYPDLSTAISNCIIGADLPNDIGNGSSAISGIRITSGRDVMVYENIVRNLTVTGGANVFGIFMENIQGNSQIFKNKVYNLTSTSVSTSAFLQGIRADVTATNQASVHNNVVYGFSHAITAPSATMVARGITANVAGTGTVGITYNSVHIHLGAAATSTALWTGGGIHAITNNVFANSSTAGATSNRFSIFRSGTGVLTSNYNNLYIEPGTNNWVGFYTANQVDLAAWQTASLGDLNSINVNPIFTGSPDLMPSNPAMNNLATVVPITDDITGALRHPSTPDMGAYEFTPPSCIQPFGLTATGITNSSAILGWSSSAALWNVEVGLPGFTPGTGDFDFSVTGTTNNPWTASPLAGNTQYEFYVMADCGGGDLSAWAGPFSFTTLCDPITDFFENFDSYATGNIVPDCWDRLIVGTGTQTISATSPASGTRNIYQYSSTAANQSYVILRALSNVSDGTHRFGAKFRVASGTGQLELGYLTNITDPATYTLIQLIPISNTVYGPITYIDIPNTVPAGARLCVRNAGTTTLSHYWDDAVYEPIPACVTPTILTVSGITATTADLGWTAGGTETMWNVEVGLPGFTPGTGASVVNVTGTTNNPWQATGLTSATSYQFYVQADCGGSGVSTWAGPFSFTTSCIYVTDFFENFDGVATPTLPVCWNKVTALGTVQTQTASNFSAPNCLYMYSSSLANTAVVSMPPVSNLQAETHRLRFMGRGNFSANAIVEVGYLTNPIDPLTFVLISSVTLTTTTYAEYIVGPTGIPAGVTTLAFRTNGTPTFSLLIDDVYWEVIPSCLAPTALTVTGITPTTADLGWTAGGTEILWNVEVGLPGFTPGTGASVVNVTGTANNPWQATGLTASTSYQFYVQADCGGSGVSTWTGPFAFFTGYCPVSTTSQLSWISNFTTTGGVDNINHTAAVGAPGGYANLTSTFVSNYNGQSTGVSLTAGGPTVGFAIWIDWNNNLIFEAGERVFVTSGYITTTTGSIAIPPATPNGDYVMRIVTDYNNSAPSNPCALISRGEYKDFTFRVVTPPSCPPPTALTATSITTNSANLGWTAGGTETMWNVEVGLIGFTPGTGASVVSATGTTNNPWQATGLNASTSYQFYVQGDCGGGDLSAWAGPFSFTTECSVISTLPYSESFDLTTWPLCWTQTYEGALTSNRWNVNATSNAGGTANEMRCIFQNAIGISRLIAPIIDLSSAVNPVLEFNHFFDDYGVGATMKIQTSTDGITWVDEAFSFVSGGGNVGPVTVTVPLTTLSATTYIAWVVDGNHFQIDYWFIDNVVIKEILPATINPIAADYDLTIPADVATTVTWNNATSITTIFDDQALPFELVANTHYTLVGNTLTILDAYLSTVLLAATDDVVLTITFDLGVATFTITAIETVPVIVVAHWDFEDAVKKAAIIDNATFLSAPYTADNGIVANVNVAPISIIGGSTFSAWVLGVTGDAPNAVNWDAGANTKYWMTTITTTGYENLKLSSVQRSSNTGPRDMKVQYSTDGLAWTDVPMATLVIANNWTSGVLDEVELPAACENQPTLMLRWIMTTDVSVNLGVVGTAGTNRIDEILITGTDVTVSVPEITTDVKVYPNPSNGQFVIESGANWTMMVYDITGRMVTSQQITVGSNDVNLLNQPSGLYFIRLFNKEQSHTIRIVIE